MYFGIYHSTISKHSRYDKSYYSFVFSHLVSVFGLVLVNYNNPGYDHKPKSRTWPHRKPVLEVVQPVHVVSSDGLRGTVSFTLRISDKSTVTQEIVMDAMCPYIKFNTQVHCNVAHSTNSLNSALRRILFNAFNKAVFLTKYQV